MIGQSQDSGVGRRGVSISPQLGHVPATGGGLWCPRRWEEPQSEPVGRRGTEGGGEVEARQDRCPWGWGDQERQAGGALPEEQKKSGGRLPRPHGHGEPAELPGRSPALQTPLQATWVLGGIGGRPGRSGEAGGRGPPRPEEQERRGGRLSCPLKPRNPAGLPGEVSCPLRPGVGAHLGPFCSVQPKPYLHSPQGLFQPCGP